MAWLASKSKKWSWRIYQRIYQNSQLEAEQRFWKSYSCANHKPQESRTGVCCASSNIMKIKGGCILPPNKQSHQSSSGQMLAPRRAALEYHLQEKQHQRLKNGQNAQINVSQMWPGESSKFSDSFPSLQKYPTICGHQVTHYGRWFRFLHVNIGKSLFLIAQTFPSFQTGIFYFNLNLCLGSFHKHMETCDT